MLDMGVNLFHSLGYKGIYWCTVYIYNVHYLGGLTMSEAERLLKNDDFLLQFKSLRSVFDLICMTSSMKVKETVNKGISPSQITPELYEKEFDELNRQLELIEAKDGKDRDDNEEQIEKILKKKKSFLQVVCRKCKTLKKLGLICEITHLEKGIDMRYKFYYPTSLGLDFNKIITNQGFPLIDTSTKSKKGFKSDYKQKSKRDYLQDYKVVEHSLNLKEVIQKLIKEFPVRSTQGIYYTLNVTHRTPYNGEYFNTEIDRSHLYQDFFKNHIMFDKNLHKKIEKFKLKCAEFWIKKNEVLDEMKLDINNHFSSEISANLDINPLDKNIFDWLYLSALYLATDKKRIFKKYFQNFKLETKIIDDDRRGDLEKRKRDWPVIKIYEHSVGTFKFLRTTTLDKDKKIKPMLEKKLFEYMKSFEQRSYYKYLIDNIKLLLEISYLRTDIIDNLEKHSLLPILPGECEYIR